MTQADDGYTGTNFSRPGVQALIEAAQAGKVQCIIVKDLSRLGRNYLEVGDFLEQKFPAWKLRFISLGDMYDSSKTAGGINMAFRGLISQMYSQDLSEKVRSSKNAASRSGKIITSHPTYGYNRDSNDRHKLVINPQEASVIKKIYDLYEQGVKFTEIAKTLNAESIITPKESRMAKGYAANQAHNYIWAAEAISSILRNEKYMGKWVYGKSRVVELGSKRTVSVPESEWIVVDDAMPAIISTEQFARVQELIKCKTKRTGAAKTEKALFARRIKCASCGRIMTYHALKHVRVYRCKFDCQTSKIEERAIHDAALNAIYAHALLTKGMVAGEKSPRNKICTIQSSIEKYKVEKMALWEEFHNKAIAYEAYKNRVNKLSNQIKQCESSITMMKTKTEEPNDFHGIKELSREMVGELITRIDVYSSDRIEITINYDDIFRLVFA